MAVPTIVKVKDVPPQGSFVNNFSEFLAVAPMQCIAGVKWFLFDTTIYNQRSVYAYFSGVIDQNIVIELYRSGVPGAAALDSDFSVPIPDATLTMAVTVPGVPERVTIDFNISNYGADKLWVKTTGTVGILQGDLDNVNLILKPE